MNVKLPTDSWMELGPSIRMVPVIHGRQAFADAVREAVAAIQPACIAVELPRALAAELIALVESLPQIGALAWKVRDGHGLVIPADPCDSLIEAVRLSLDYDIPLEFVDTLEAGSRLPLFRLPDVAAVSRLGVRLYTEQCLEKLPRLKVTDRERIIATRLSRLANEFGNVLHVGGLGHFENLRDLIAGREDVPETPEPPFETKHMRLSERELDYVLQEIPYVAWLYENYRAAHGPEDRFPMHAALKRLLHRVAEQYEEEYDERVNLTEWRAIFQYARNLALTAEKLQPGFYEIVTAAKGCVNDDFGAICFDVATHYPPNHHEEEAPTEDEEPKSGPDHRALSLHCEFPSGTEKLHAAYPFPELGELSFDFKRRPRATEFEKSQWRAQFGEDLWNGAGICSWPPEDFFIENLFRTIRHRAYQQIGEAHNSVEEFGGSMLDGLDLRETLRHLHDGKIFVKKERRPPGKVGPVVIIWRDLPLGLRGLWQTCLYAENNNESDIAFYARPLGEEMVGPGISRTDYFGILSVFPARGIPNVWSILPFYRWRSSGRLLTAATIMLSEERYIAHVATKPPDEELRAFARQNEKSLVHMPMESFGRKLMARARQCHILSNKEIRGWADQYIPKL